MSQYDDYEEKIYDNYDEKVFNQTVERCKIVLGHMDAIKSTVTNMMSYSTKYYNYFIANHASSNTNTPFSTNLYILFLSNKSNGNITEELVSIDCHPVDVANIIEIYKSRLDEYIYNKIIELSKETPDNMICHVALMENFVIVWYGHIIDRHIAIYNITTPMYGLLNIDNNCIVLPLNIFINYRDYNKITPVCIICTTPNKNSIICPKCALPFCSITCQQKNSDYHKRICSQFVKID